MLQLMRYVLKMSSDFWVFNMEIIDRGVELGELVPHDSATLLKPLHNKFWFVEFRAASHFTASAWRSLERMRDF